MHALVIPQPGHSHPVIFLNMQGTARPVSRTNTAYKQPAESRTASRQMIFLILFLLGSISYLLSPIRVVVIVVVTLSGIAAVWIICILVVSAIIWLIWCLIISAILLVLIVTTVLLILIVSAILLLVLVVTAILLILVVSTILLLIHVLSIAAGHSTELINCVLRKRIVDNSKSEKLKNYKQDTAVA